MRATLSVNLNALKANYRLLQSRHANQASAAVVKANGYGLGVEAVSNALWDEGCQEFFVATLEEGIELRSVLPTEALIAVFNGPNTGEEKEYLAHALIPILNKPEHIALWKNASDTAKAILHVDTGMTRLGFTQTELIQLLESDKTFFNTRLTMLMSHLSCANEPENPKNNEQLQRFNEAKSQLGNIRSCLCNSSGLFLHSDYHYDLGRPGCALYGINPTAGDNPMQHVATLSAPILQIRTLDRDESIGYGATYQAQKGDKIAIIGLGYADGWMRMQSNTGTAYIKGKAVPFAGRVSMDMIALDVSTLDNTITDSATAAEFINATQPVDVIAQACNTIGYEIFTRLGNRIQRRYD